MNYFEKLKRLVNDRVEPARDKNYEIFRCLMDGVDSDDLTRFTFAQAYVYVQDRMPEAKFDEVQHCVRMMDFMGHIKWLGHTRQGNNYIPIFDAVRRD